MRTISTKKLIFDKNVIKTPFPREWSIYVKPYYNAKTLKKTELLGTRSEPKNDIQLLITSIAFFLSLSGRRTPTPSYINC